MARHQHHCPHSPACPSAESVDHEAARVINEHLDQGWSLLCNGVVVFTDLGEILPDGQTVEARLLPASAFRAAA